jgi:predicted regulator of Ras-like GTPase activity (Roadblock/LC7/MglB family)
MTSLLVPQETLGLATAGSISRLGAFVSTRTLNQAAGVAEGLLLAKSGTAGMECISPTTEALVKSAVGWSVWRPMSEDFDSTHHYADNEAVAVMESGHMHVLSEGTVVADRPVFARITSDGGSNTVLGKVRGDSDVVSGGVVITPDASFAAAVSSFSITLSDGLVIESFTFTSDATPITAEVAAGLVALIDASANFAATGTVTISITSTTGIVEILSIDERLPVTTPARAMRVPGAFFDQSRTGAGLVEIRQAKVN